MPLEEVKDPTGAGDSFAGGFLGYLDGLDGDVSGDDYFDGRWPTEPCSPPSTSRNSARSGYPSLTRDEIEHAGSASFDR